MSEKWVEVVVRSKRNAPFPCSPVIREWLQKKTEIEKRNKQKKANDFFLCQGSMSNTGIYGNADMHESYLKTKKKLYRKNWFLSKDLK